MQLAGEASNPAIDPMVAAAEINCHTARHKANKLCLVTMCLHASKQCGKQWSRGIALTWTLHPQLSTCEEVG
eukprot:SM003990S15171  [mRNA]  locus=s3990:12:1292:- [translate_table: standard]